MKIFLFLPLIYIYSLSSASTLHIVDKSNKVDSIYNNQSVIVKIADISRKPVFSWELKGSAIVLSFNLKISTSNDFSSPVWDYTSSTQTHRILNDTIKVVYNGQDLTPQTSYHWKVSIYDTSFSSPVAVGQFFTTSAAVILDGTKADMKIDFNNPLRPGKITKFRISAFDRDRDFKLRIFSISGRLVKDWDKITVLKDTYYTIDWDGKDAEGNFVDRGIYIVNLYDETDNLKINRRLAVIKNSR